MANSHFSVTTFALFALFAVTLAVPFVQSGQQDLSTRVVNRQSEGTGEGQGESSDIVEEPTESPAPIATPVSMGPREPMETFEPMESDELEPSAEVTGEAEVTTDSKGTVPMPVQNPKEFPEESPEESPEEECVDAAHLTAYPAHTLVHKTDITSNVLCPRDSSLPCATANHLLRVDGKPVSYREYCEDVQCSKKVMKVNSVFSHLWEEQTHHNGVVLTMFDGRHPETVQKALHRVMAAGRTVVNRFR